MKAALESLERKLRTLMEIVGGDMVAFERGAADFRRKCQRLIRSVRAEEQRERARNRRRRAQSRAYLAISSSTARPRSM